MSAELNHSTELSVSGMTCGNCARHVTDAIQSVPGVRSAMVSLDSRRASVRWADGAEQNAAALVQAVEKEGYGAKVVEISEHGHDHAEHQLAGGQVNLVIAVLGTAPLMIGEWVFSLGMMPWFHWFSFALASVVQVFAGAQFYRGAWNQLKIRSSNMDTLVALGSTTAFGYSVWALLSGRGGDLYFMEAASIITLISAGHWIESRVSVRASDALKKLLNLAPQTARRLRFNPKEVPEISPGLRKDAGRYPGNPILQIVFTPERVAENLNISSGAKEEEVPVSELNVGDLVALRPGD